MCGDNGVNATLEGANRDIVVLMDDGLVRLTEPLVRDAGRLRPASWEEALERAAAGFATARDKGPNAFGMFSCSKQSNEMNYIAQNFPLVALHTNTIATST